MAARQALRRPMLTLSSTKFRFAVQAMARHEHTFSSYMVTPDQLAYALKKNSPTQLSTAPRTIPVCGTWFLPNDPQKRTGSQVFVESHIPQARFFDLDAITDTSSPYPHMLPSPNVFADAMRKMGIRMHDTVVVYDSAELGIFSAPRVAWTFKVFGHPVVHILNNYRLWIDQGLPTEQGDSKAFQTAEYPTPNLDKSKVIAFEEMLEIAKDYNKEGHEGIQILDARSEGRWKGTEPEPRAGLSSGHMPGSISIPLPCLLDPNSKALLPPDELRKVFQQKAVDPCQPIVASCGTGVTAAVIDAALHEAGLGGGSRRIYDGSWTEWAQRVKPTDCFVIKEEG